MCHVKFKSDGHHFSWRKPVTTIHNILVGSLYVDQVCVLVIICIAVLKEGSVRSVYIFLHGT